MSDPDKVRGYIGPTPSEPKKEEISADEEKFKKVMKVEAGSESEKKQRRPMKKTPEEEEEEEKVDEGPTPAAGEFKQHLMEKGEELIEPGTGKRVGGGFTAEGAPDDMGVTGGELSHEEHELLGGPPIERGPEEAQPPLTEEAPKKPEAKRKEKEVDTSLLAGKTKRGELKKKSELKEEVPIEEEGAPLEEKEEGIAPAVKEEKKAEEKEAPLTPAAAPHMAAPSVEAPPPLPETTPTAYTRLPPQVAAIFDKMVGIMTIEQHGDVSTTTVTIDMPGSVFDGADVVLKHYSTTAPNAFNVEIQGSPEALELLSTHIADLEAAFVQGNLPYQVNIQRPVLQERYRVTQKRGKEGGKEKR